MDERERLIRGLFEDVWSRGQFEGLDQQIGDVTFHYGDSTITLGVQRLIALIRSWRIGFPDLEFRVEDLVQAGDRIAVRSRLSGTHLGEWRDHAPSGRRFDIDVAMFFRFEQGQLVEIWEVEDARTRNEQLGF